MELSHKKQFSGMPNPISFKVHPNYLSIQSRPPLHSMYIKYVNVYTGCALSPIVSCYRTSYLHIHVLYNKTQLEWFLKQSERVKH